jgi:hypothetical protein
MTLRVIRTFDQLLRYLGTELDWPVEEYGFDELTFEYEPAELGLKDENAARINGPIYQLRPLSGSGQPWGIFFVEFEQKKLPVVVLRRILSHLVIKKRASANHTDAKRWHASNLLFISAFDDDANPSAPREIAFAHFHQNAGDMPTLRVLGWDSDDTPLKLDHVAATLKNRLHWPDDTTDAAAWREQWSTAFRHGLRHSIRTANDLAETLAALARQIRDRCATMMRAESERGPITKLYKAFQIALIHDLTPETFADTYAQTITYGSIDLFRALAALGGELVSLHLLESPKLASPITQFTGANRTGGKVGWTPDDGGTVWIDGKGTSKAFQAGTSGFHPIPENVWRFHIGGYQVCEKWLKDRKGRTLTDDDLAHYHKIVIALTETIRLMSEIDTTINAHGGWPGAFQPTPVSNS